jgi:type II secretory ATPase GspE/PulE/Tfp pilus assembly ATPase PilB-like protein
VVSKEIANLITDGATAKELLDLAKSQGMKTLKESAIELAMQGIVTLEDAIYVTQ